MHWSASPGRPLSGSFAVPGDKSVSHRALMLAAIADGTSRIDGFLEGEDTCATAAILSQLGVRIEAPGEGCRIVHGVGIDGLQAPGSALDCGNAGTGMRLLAGLLAGQRFDTTLAGDASLSRRPMRRIVEPLSRMGARIDSNEDGTPPLRVHAVGDGLHGIDFEARVASAQVKSAILLAGLYAKGETVVREPQPTRDYTERMLAAFGYPIEFAAGHARIEGGHRMRATDVKVPADFSSAAFFLVAASVIPGSDLRLQDVGINPRRTGLLHVLRAMGADITETAAGESGGEAVADLRVRHAPLHGIEVPEEHVADMIDEFPALFVAAACARGRTVVSGAAELRVKESDRIAGMAQGLRALGAEIDEKPDGAVIEGGPLRGGKVDSHGDHRLAMSLALAGLAAPSPVKVRHAEILRESFPDFVEQLKRLGVTGTVKERS